MYGYLNKETGQEFSIPAKNVDLFFEKIESLTGLDRIIAEAILNQKPIEHPRYRFYKRNEK